MRWGEVTISLWPGTSQHLYHHYPIHVGLLTDNEADHILLVDNLKIVVEDSPGGSARHYRWHQGTKTSWPPNVKMDIAIVI